MFYDKYVRLCNSVNKSPSGVAIEIGLAKPTVNRWKNGTTPTDATLEKIAQYFGIDAAELKEAKKTASQTGDGNEKEFIELLSMLTPEEQEREIAYLRDLVRRRGTPSAE